jgi:hypothetical protein
VITTRLELVLYGLVVENVACERLACDNPLLKHGPAAARICIGWASCAHEQRRALLCRACIALLDGLPEPRRCPRCARSSPVVALSLHPVG